MQEGLAPLVFGSPLSNVASRSRVRPWEEETIEKRFWYDGLGRPLVLVERVEGGRTVTSGQKEFGVRGQVVREYDPVGGGG